MAEENKQQSSELPKGAAEQAQPIEGEAHPGWRAIFRQAFEKARRENRPANRSGLGRDHSRSLFLLAGAAIAVLLLFLGVFSSPNQGRKSANGKQRMPLDRQTPGQEESATPMLNAQLAPSDAAGSKGVTAEDIDKTARPSFGSRPQPAAIGAGKAAPHALGQIDFSGAAASEPPLEPASSSKPATLGQNEDFLFTPLVNVSFLPEAARGRVLPLCRPAKCTLADLGERAPL